MTKRGRRFLILGLIPVAFASALTAVELATGVGRSAVALNRADRLMREGNLAGAEASCDQTIALRPDWAPAYNLRASVRAAAGAWDRAIADGERACELSPRQLDFQRNLSSCLNGRGVVRCAAGDYDGALADYEQAWKLFPESPAVPVNLAAVLNDRGALRLRAGNYDGAIADLRRSMEVRPEAGEELNADRRKNLRDALAARGRLRLDGNELDLAVEDLTDAARVDPASAEVRDLAATALIRRGRKDEGQGRREIAAADYTHAIELYPEVPEGDPKPAGPTAVRVEFLPVLLPMAWRGASPSPGQGPSALAEAYCLRGAARLAQNELDEAAADLARAVALYPAYAEAYEGLGLVRLRQKDDHEAERLFGIYRGLRPGEEARLKAKIEAARRQPNP